MKALARLCLVLVALTVLSPLVAAQNNGEVGSGADGLTTTCVPTRELSAIAGVITATDLNACSSVPAIVHRSSLDSNGATTGFATIQGTIAVAGPNIPTGGVATYTYGFVGFAGCNTGSSAQQDDVLAAGSGSSFHYLLDMTADECHGYITVTITAGAVPVTIAHFYFPVDVRAEQAFDDTLNVVNSGTLDITDRLCAASALGASCTTPTINAAVTGSLTTTVSGTLTLSGTMNAVVSGTLDVLDRICAAAPTGTSCTIAGLNVHQDQACGASFATRCYGELSGITVNQTVGSMVVPSNFTLNGGGIPIQVGNEHGEFFLGVLIWLVAFFVCLRFSKLLSAGACTLGVIVSAMQLSLGWQAACVGVLGITLWLEALGRDKIILAFFNPDMKQKQLTE